MKFAGLCILAIVLAYAACRTPLDECDSPNCEIQKKYVKKFDECNAINCPECRRDCCNPCCLAKKCTKIYCKNHCRSPPTKIINIFNNTTTKTEYRPTPNVTTVIRVVNVVNHTNEINVPITFNHTQKYNLTLDKQSDVNSTCCIVVEPMQCIPQTAYPFMKCFHERRRACGEICTETTINYPRDSTTRCKPSAWGFPPTSYPYFGYPYGPATPEMPQPQPPVSAGNITMPSDANDGPISGFLHPFYPLPNFPTVQNSKRNIINNDTSTEVLD